MSAKQSRELGARGKLLPRLKIFSSMFTSFSSRNFKFYFWGQVISICGTWIQQIALSWLIYRLTDSLLLLMVVTLAHQLPTLVITPFAGAWCDRVNRYKVIFGTQFIFMILAFVLSFLVLGGYVVDISDSWILILLSGLSGVVSAVDAPFRQSFYSKLVPAKDMSNAIALNSVTINIGRFIGPMIGGFFIAGFGEGLCFLINGMSYIAVLVAMLQIKLPQSIARNHSESVFDTLKDGISYIYRHQYIRLILLFVSMISLIALPVMSVLPALVKDVYGGDSILLGYVNSAIGAGSVVATLWLATMRSSKRFGAIFTMMGVMMGLSMMGLSMTTNPWIACVCALPLGFAMIGSMAVSNIILQTVVDDSKRGRVMSFFTLALMGMCPIGGLLYVPMTEWLSLRGVIFTTGGLVILSGIVFEYYRRAISATPHGRGGCA